MGNPRLRYRDIIGQEKIVTRLKAFTDFFVESGGTPGHVLLIGEDGMGKAGIATAFCNERNVGFQEVDAVTLEVTGDLTALLTNLRPNQVLFLQNIHRLRGNLCSRLRGALRDGRLEINIGQGPAQRTHIMDLNPFTLIGTCLKESDCPKELLREFSLILTMQPYSKEELEGLAQSMAHFSSLALEPASAELIARACNGRPGHLETTLRQVARAINKNVISEADVLKVFLAFGVNVGREIVPNGMGKLQDMSGQEFELLISGLLTSMGFHAEMTKTTGDGGIDIIAVLDGPILGGRYLFQCKRFSPDNLVGAPTVRDFYGAVTADRAVKGIFITTSDFTTQAREFGQKVGVELINSERLGKLLLEYQLIETHND